MFSHTGHLLYPTWYFISNKHTFHINTLTPWHLQDRCGYSSCSIKIPSTGFQLVSPPTLWVTPHGGSTGFNTRCLSFAMPLIKPRSPFNVANCFEFFHCDIICQLMWTSLGQTVQLVYLKESLSGPKVSLLLMYYNTSIKNKDEQITYWLINKKGVWCFDIFKCRFSFYVLLNENLFLMCVN